VWSAKRAVHDKTRRGRLGDGGSDLGDFERAVMFERRQDPWKPSGEHDFAGSRRADHHEVVAAGGGHLEGALGSLAAADFTEIGRASERVAVRSRELDGGNAAEVIDELAQGADGEDLQRSETRCLGGVSGRHEDGFDSFAGSGLGDSDPAAQGTNGAVEVELAAEELRVERGRRKLAERCERSRSDREIEGWCILRLIDRLDASTYLTGGPFETSRSDG
jgi:hypothetical protein